MNIGDIGEEMEAVDIAYDRFTDAANGPCMEDYASDAEAYATLGAAALELRQATDRLLERLAPVVSPPPTQEPQDEQLEQCPNCGGMSINATTASIRCCLDCGRDVTPILWVRATLSSPQAPQEGK